jgi:hypothetical protein
MKKPVKSKQAKKNDFNGQICEDRVKEEKTRQKNNQHNHDGPCEWRSVSE